MYAQAAPATWVQVPSGLATGVPVCVLSSAGHQAPARAGFPVLTYTEAGGCSVFPDRRRAELYSLSRHLLSLLADPPFIPTIANGIFGGRSTWDNDEHCGKEISTPEPVGGKEVAGDAWAEAANGNAPSDT